MAQSKEAKDSDRGLTWTHHETLALIRVWSDTDIQSDFETCKRNTSVYERIARRLGECGYERSAIQCRTKIKSLKKDYFNTKKDNGKSGRGRKSSPFFEEIDSVLGHRPASAPPVLIDTSLSDRQESETEEQSIDGDSELDVPQETQGQDEAQARGNTPDAGAAPHDNIETIEAPESINEPQRDPDLPVISLKRKRGYTRVAAKKQNKTEQLEATLEKTINSFLQYQREAEERFEEREDKRRQDEREAAEREREKDREHELRLFRMLSGFNPDMMSSPQHYSGPVHNMTHQHQPRHTSSMEPQHTRGYFTDMMSQHQNDEQDENLEMSYTNL